MYLEANLISLQSELRVLDKDGDKLKRIKYKSGNEETISQIIHIVKSYCSKANVSDDKKHRIDFLTFLLLNSNLANNLLVTEEYQHLVKVIPTLTSCLIANIIVEANLIDEYCELMQTLSLKLNNELLFELQICLTHCGLLSGLNWTSRLIRALIPLFQSYESDNEGLEQICDIANEMLKNITYFSPEKARELDFLKFQEHMGCTLLHILQIINLCPLCHVNLSRFLDCTINVAIKVMKAVTLNVFCVWAQVKCENGFPLQLVVAEEAYLVIEHLEKYKPAGTLREMLSTIARKPIKLTEKILHAELSDIIVQINRADEHQSLWFRALVNLNVFEDKDAIKCLKKWHHLCNYEDVFFMLNSCKNISLTIQCARNLKILDLKNVIMKSFRSDTHILNEDISNELILFLNKFEDCDNTEENFKNLLIFCLQNRECVLRTLYEKCLEKSAMVSKFKTIFHIIKDVMVVNDFCKTICLQVMESNMPNDHNVISYRDLLTMLLELDYFTDEHVNDIFSLCLQRIGNDNNMLATLTIFNMLPVKFQLMKGQENLVIFLLNLLEKYRSQFYELPLASAIAQECIDLLCKFSKNVQCSYVEAKLNQVALTHINRYYAIKFTSSSTKFLRYVYLSDTTAECAEYVVILIKVLPVCVKSEWILIVNELIEQLGYETTLKLFGKVMFSISQLSTSSEVDSKIVYCLQQYSVIIKDVIQPKYNTLKDEQILAKQLCMLLKNIPEGICKTESIRWAGLLSNEVLKSLKDDREFILLLIAIQHTGVPQLLAQKMLQ